MLLPTRQVEKPWGRHVLPEVFGDTNGQRIGEIWFEPPPQMAGLLVKYIFTSQKLSVQVHPSDAQTQAAGLGIQGKEECWLVLDAEPGATLGVGFREEISAEDMRAAALDGSIEDLLDWHAVQKGDFFYIPANTVHAIGPGVTLVEVQQNSDITYRLFDYGRPRDLHLDQAVSVAKGCPHDPQLRRTLPDNGSAQLVCGPHFQLDRVDGLPAQGLSTHYTGGLLAIPLNASLVVQGQTIAAGQCALAAHLDQVEFASGVQCLLAAMPQ